jgi:hypothetical protein
MIGWLRRKRDDTAREVRGRLGEDAIVRLDDVVRFFGLESASRFQIRGNGCLAATAEELLFVLWLPRAEVRIDRSSISRVDTPRSHRGKATLRRLLRVHYTDPTGGQDAAAWEVRDLDAWLEVLGSGVARNA